MIYSKEKLYDLHARKDCLDLMEWGFREFAKTKMQMYWDFALEMGQISKRWDEIIKTKNYV